MAKSQEHHLLEKLNSRLTNRMDGGGGIWVSRRVGGKVLV